MRLTLNKNLASLRSAAIRSIDEQAEKIRHLFITPGAGQSMVYQQKRIEAELVLSGTYSPEEVPHIVLEAALNNISHHDQAVIIVTMAQQWKEISAEIETRRLEAKSRVRSATTPAEIDAAVNIDWSDLEAQAV